MSDRLQISASLHKDLIKWINALPERDKNVNSFSQMVEVLLWEAKAEREKENKKGGVA